MNKKEIIWYKTKSIWKTLIVLLNRLSENKLHNWEPKRAIKRYMSDLIFLKTDQNNKSWKMENLVDESAGS